MNHSQDLSGTGGVVLIALVANMPQLIIPFQYFSYTGIFTCMLLAKEMETRTDPNGSNFLRVTTPISRHRSILLIACNYHTVIVFHPLQSQALYTGSFRNQSINLPCPCRLYRTQAL